MVVNKQYGTNLSDLDTKLSVKMYRRTPNFFDLYQEKTYKEMKQWNSNLANVLPQFYIFYIIMEKRQICHIIMDNVFTSLPFLEELHKRGYNATGTIRIN